MRPFFAATVLYLSSVAFSFAQPQFKFDDTRHNFGFVHQGVLVKLEYAFTNTGNEPIVITNAKVACNCTVVDFPQNPVKPGEKGIVKISFDTNGKYDRQDRTVDIISNAEGSPHQLRFKGVVLKKK